MAEDCRRSIGVEEVVEKLGFGMAQLHIVVLAYGVWYVESLHICMAMLLADASAHEFHVGSEKAAVSMAVIFAGITGGGFVGGYVGDRHGRLPPVLVSYAMACAAQLWTAFAHTNWLLVVLRFLLGFAHGLGMSPCIVLVSECAPASSRGMLQALRNIFVTCGAVTANFVVCADSPSLLHLRWRHDLLLGVAPPLLLGLAASVWLCESPVFLASAGRGKAAEKILCDIRRSNGRPSVDVSFDGGVAAAGSRGAADESASPTAEGQLSIVFGRRLRWVTLTLVWSQLAMCVMVYGHLYTFPKIAPHSHSAMLPGRQSLVQSLLAVPIGLLVFAMAAVMDCRTILLLGMLLCVAGPAAFAATADIESRSQFQEAVYFISQNVPNLSAAMLTVACFQLAVDLYPVRASATSASLLLAVGRLGSFMAPFLYASFAKWQTLYFLMSAMAAVSLVLIVAFLNEGPWGAGAAGELHDDRCPESSRRPAPRLSDV